MNNLLEYELNLFQKGKRYVAGVDEVGRGPLAGPMVVAAVILNLEHLFEYINDDVTYAPYNEINDSKKIVQNKRERLNEFIIKKCISYSIIEIDNALIDKKGIAHSTQYGFFNAIKKLNYVPEHILTDHFSIHAIPTDIQTNISKGDSLSISIAAASIIAKVYRDNLMGHAHGQFPKYGFDKHKGYGTKEHVLNISKYGLCPLHRKSFCTKIITENVCNM